MQKHFDSDISQARTEGKSSSNLDIVSLYQDINQSNNNGQPLRGSDKLATIKSADTSHLDINFDNFYGSALKSNDQSKIPSDHNQTKVAESREHLALDAGFLISDGNEQAAFKANMKTFEARQKSGEISSLEVAKTYQAVDQLLTAPGGIVSPQDRVLLAQNFMHLAAHPSESDQGVYSTCNVTAMQEKILTRHPSKAAEILAEGTITGSFTAPDGKIIKLDAESMKPNHNFPGEDGATPQDGVRSYGTQVLNHILVNEMTQRVTETHNTMLYTQNHERSGDDHGERLISPRDGSEMTTDDGTPIRGPGLTGKDVAAALKRYTGEDNTVLVKDGGTTSDERVTISNSEDLIKVLNQAKKENRTPLLVEVNGADPLFEGGFAGNQHVSHVLSIRDYDPKSNTISVSNQWGKSNDIQANPDDFYRTMLKTSGHPA